LLRRDCTVHRLTRALRLTAFAQMLYTSQTRVPLSATTVLMIKGDSKYESYFN